MAGGITAASGCCCVGVILFTCLCGLPMIIAGVVLIVLFDQTTAGISVLSVATILVLGGFVLMTLMCTGKIGQKGYTGNKSFFRSQSAQRSVSGGRGPPDSPVDPWRSGRAGSPPAISGYGQPPSYNPAPGQLEQGHRMAPNEHSQMYRTVPTVEPSAPPIDDAYG